VSRSSGNIPEPLTLTNSRKGRGDRISTSCSIAPSPLEGEGRGEGWGSPETFMVPTNDHLCELCGMISGLAVIVLVGSKPSCVKVTA
jgi:hypothetical protein